MLDDEFEKFVKESVQSPPGARRRKGPRIRNKPSPQARWIFIYLPLIGAFLALVAYTFWQTSQ